MLIDSKYTKIFVSDELTRLKYGELHQFAEDLLSVKNEISKEINSNLYFFLEMNALSFVTFARNEYQDTILSNVPSSFDKQLLVQVHTCYQNKFDAIKKKLEFNQITFLGFEFYKRNSKKHKKGDFKKVNIKKEKTSLSNCLTYLARYGNDNTVEYIKSRLNEADENKRKYYLSILRVICKFGFGRLMALAQSKRDRIIAWYSRKPIEFKSLTFSGRSRKQEIVSYNSNYNSKINAFVALSGMSGRKSFFIPVKFNKDYHGNMKEYKKSANDYEYVITFNEKRKIVNINLCKDGKRYTPEVDENSSLIGIDVNIKHNLFALSDGTTYDYDRELVNKFCQESIRNDKLKEEFNKNHKGKDKETFKLGKRKQSVVDSLRNKIKKRNQELISNMCKNLKEQGITHIVMEDLNGGFGKSFVKDKSNEDINFNRIVRFLQISSLKDEVEHIARKYDISVSKVQSYYTSKMCPICGCIDDENRDCQEEFECVECHHSENADINAAINIKNRVDQAVLRTHLLKQVDNGSFIPRKLSKEKVKKVLLSYRSNLKEISPKVENTKIS